MVVFKGEHVIRGGNSGIHRKLGKARIREIIAPNPAALIRYISHLSLPPRITILALALKGTLSLDMAYF